MDYTSIFINTKVCIKRRDCARRRPIQNARISRQDAAPTNCYGNEHDKRCPSQTRVGVASSHEFLCATFESACDELFGPAFDMSSGRM